MSQSEFDLFKSTFTREDVQHTLKFSTLQALHNAVRVFGGAPPDAFNQSVRQLGEKGGVTAIFLLHSMPRGNTANFAERVVEKIGTLPPEVGYYGS